MNHQSVSQWSFEKNYYSKSKSVYPRRAASVVDFLKISTRQGNNLDPICSIFPMMIVYVHHPSELPLKSTPFLHVDFQDLYIIKIKPEVTVSTNLESYSPERRKCFYSYERKLIYYKFYTEINCKMECLVNTTLKLCGCVPYYAPSKYLVVCES